MPPPADNPTTVLQPSWDESDAEAHAFLIKLEPWLAAKNEDFPILWTQGIVSRSGKTYCKSDIHVSPSDAN